MKRILAIMLVLLMTVPLVLSGCNDSKDDGDDSTTTGTNDSTAGSQSGLPADVTLDTWISDGYEKVTSRTRCPKNAVTDYTIYMAKNEKEGFHVSVRTSADVDGLQLVLAEGDQSKLPVEISEEYLIKTGSNYYPDPLVPYTDGFSTEADVSKTLLVCFKATSETASGDHKFKFALKDAAGNVLQEYNIIVSVWNFALPEALTCESATGFSVDNIMHYEHIPSSQRENYTKAYYEMLLDYGMSSYHLPYDILSSEADAYMSDPRCTSFQVPVSGSDDEKLLAYYEKLLTNEEWLDKAYFYPFDEPQTIEHLNKLAETCERLKRLCPKIRIVIPFFRNIEYNGTTDEIDFLDDYLGIWCPKAACWTKGWLEDPLNNGYFGDRMDAQKADGDKIWWYVCWEPGDPYCNLYVDEIGLEHVELFWQQYYYGSDGFLYWAATYWEYTGNPWKNMATVPSLSPNVYGDGSLLYPGKYVGVKGPVASLRLECIRTGMEDFDLLKMAEELLGREWVEEQVIKVSASLTSHTKKNEVYNETRKAIGDAIEAAINS